MPVTSGTTNVDFNPSMRAALAGAVATASQILLKVGDEEVTAVTEASSVTERKVDLPTRWIKGFGEVSALHASFAAFAVGVAGGRNAADRAFSECHGTDWYVTDAEYEALAGVLADRNPPWLADLVERRLTARVPLGLGAWPLTRSLVRLGAIERPAVPEYGARMARALTQDPPLSPPLEPGQSGFEPPWYDGPRREMAGTGGDRLAHAHAAMRDVRTTTGHRARLPRAGSRQPGL